MKNIPFSSKKLTTYGTVKNNMKGYERNHTCLPSGREVTERKLILCVTDTSCSPNIELCNFTGIEREHEVSPT